MAIRNIRKMGDDVLRKSSKEVKEMTPRLQTLIDDMFETMYQAYGVGLAAPQVGILKRLVVIDTYEGQPLVLINPKIVEKDGEQIGDEGCLSLPGKVAVVKRPNHVICEALDRDMNPVTVEGEGLLARAICHELDHLDGVLYPDVAEEPVRDADEEEE
ncbi:peptide deformylase [Anaerostipes sp.]|uniref:peptide deformylase n=1 Tax=Anaerostipes sp. TaxID=1872530 RepID=UPI0025B9592D|nr:peptide deformylase [Anaerostipes sp.]MBS7007845.1 peptide deformylase [Anaerostipes sp.]